MWVVQNKAAYLSLCYFFFNFISTLIYKLLDLDQKPLYMVFICFHLFLPRLSKYTKTSVTGAVSTNSFLFFLGTQPNYFPIPFFLGKWRYVTEFLAMECGYKWWITLRKTALGLDTEKIIKNCKALEADKGNDENSWLLNDLLEYCVSCASSPPHQLY